MQQFLRTVSSAYTTYEQSSVGGDGVNLPLDKIEVAGHLLLSTLRRTTSLAFVREAAESIDCSDSFKRLIAKSFCRSLSRVTARKWAPRLEELAASVVVAECGLDELFFTSRFFTVAKDLEVSRAIFSGHALSAMFHIPGPVNILPSPSYIGLLARQVGLLGVGCWYLADIRHWYHQIPVCEYASRHFGVRTPERAYRYRVLPMGWAHACRIAQCLALGILLHRNAGDEALGIVEDLSKNDNPPQFVLLEEHGAVVGFLTTLYDNIAVWSTQCALVRKWKDRCEANCRRFNVTLKTSHIYHHEHMTNPCEGGVYNYPVHLGVEYAYVRSRRERSLQWRHPRSKLQSWAQLRIHPESSKFTPAHYAKIVGVILWDVSVQQKPFAGVSHVIEILRLVARAVGGKTKQWHVLQLDIGEASRRVLNTALEMVLCSGWYSSSVNWKSKRLDVFGVSDASNEALGWSVFGILQDIMNGDFIPCDDWIPGYDGEHIFLREMRAAEYVIRDLLIRYYDTVPLTLHVGIDATAVVHALSRGFSSNPIANEIVLRILAYLADAGCSTLVCVPLRGKDNYADDPSHLRFGTDARKKATLQVLSDFLRGLTRKVRVEKKWEAGEYGLRHMEGGAEDILGAEPLEYDSAEEGELVPLE
jgi:hypothetical protein